MCKDEGRTGKGNGKLLLTDLNETLCGGCEHTHVVKNTQLQIQSCILRNVGNQSWDQHRNA